jgi:hypothetical protein
MDLRQQLLELRVEAGCAMTESALRRALVKLVDALIAEINVPVAATAPCYHCDRTSGHTITCPLAAR